EGPPVLIDSLTVAGLDSVPSRLRERLIRPLDHLRGGIYDRDTLLAVIDTTVTRLLNNGYAHATDPPRDINLEEATKPAVFNRPRTPPKSAHIAMIEMKAEANK